MIMKLNEKLFPQLTPIEFDVYSHLGDAMADMFRRRYPKPFELFSKNLQGQGYNQGYLDAFELKENEILHLRDEIRMLKQQIGEKK